MKKKVLATVISVMMIVTFIPTFAFAAEGTSFEEDVNAELETDVSEDLDAEEVAEFVDDIAGTDDVIKDIDEEDEDFIIGGEDAEIIVSDDEVVLDGGEADEQISMSLPEEFNHMEGTLAGDGTIVYTEEKTDAALTVQAVKKQQDDICLDGFRSLLTIKNAHAPHEYSFQFDLPEGAKLVQDGDYINIINENNMVTDENGENPEPEVLGVIEPAWAKDINGNSVNTYYSINGNTLTQVVEFNENSDFPIIADPTVIIMGKPDCAFDWWATAYTIKVKVSNFDPQRIKVKATATIGDNNKSVEFYVKSGDTQSRKIKWDLKTAYKQNINVHFKISEKNKTTRNKDMPGSRKLDSYLIDSWTKGGESSKEKAINSHFKKHGAEVGCSNNIKDYTKQAYKYRKKCKEGEGIDISNSLGPRYKFKFYSPYRYIMLTKNSSKGKIVSFGG